MDDKQLEKSINDKWSKSFEDLFLYMGCVVYLTKEEQDYLTHKILDNLEDGRQGTREEA